LFAATTKSRTTVTKLEIGALADTSAQAVDTPNCQYCKTFEPFAPIKDFPYCVKFQPLDAVYPPAFETSSKLKSLGSYLKIFVSLAANNWTVSPNFPATTLVKGSLALSENAFIVGSCP